MILKGRNVVITGGTRGIGRELVRMLYPDNSVFVIARDADRLASLCSEYPGLATCRADLARLKDVDAAVDGICARFEKLDLLINNAAVQHSPMFIDEDFDYASIQQEITVNFTAVCALVAKLLPSMVHDRDAAIVNVNSGLGLVPKKNSAVYCATKAAVNVFSQSLRHQLEDTRVRVLQAFMPLVATAMTAGRGKDKMSARDAAEALLRGVEQDIEDHDIGKVRMLRSLNRIAPGIARMIMKAA